MTPHEEFHYSVTMRARDIAVLHCLRALAQYSQKTGSLKMIAWGGTDEPAWKEANGQVTFRFTSSEYRQGFEEEALRLLPRELHEVIARNDSDPARPR